jgi:hypothetical protein
MPSFWARSSGRRSVKRWNGNITAQKVTGNVGSWYAGVRECYFALLITDEARNPKGIEVLKTMWPRTPTLDHRPDGMRNIKSCGLLRWSQIGEVLERCAGEAGAARERVFASNAVAWMKDRKLF